MIPNRRLKSTDKTRRSRGNFVAWRLLSPPGTPCPKAPADKFCRWCQCSLCRRSWTIQLAFETVYLNCSTAAVADMFYQFHCRREKHILPFARCLCLCRRRLQCHQPYFADEIVEDFSSVEDEAGCFVTELLRDSFGFRLLVLFVNDWQAQNIALPCRISTSKCPVNNVRLVPFRVTALFSK